jgi:hypothetical protein
MQIHVLVPVQQSANLPPHHPDRSARECSLACGLVANATNQSYILPYVVDLGSTSDFPIFGAATQAVAALATMAVGCFIARGCPLNSFVAPPG